MEKSVLTNQVQTIVIQHQKLGYSVVELSKLVGICERKIWEEIKQKKLKAARIGKRVVIRADAVEAWLSEAETEKEFE